MHFQRYYYARDITRLDAIGELEDQTVEGTRAGKRKKPKLPRRRKSAPKARTVAVEQQEQPAAQTSPFRRPGAAGRRERVQQSRCKPSHESREPAPVAGGDRQAALGAARREHASEARRAQCERSAARRAQRRPRRSELRLGCPALAAVTARGRQRIAGTSWSLGRRSSRVRSCSAPRAKPHLTLSATALKPHLSRT